MKLNRKRKGFTLVEIMIVVAIIALLATIAVPNFLRVRKRSQATRILEELRLIEGAKDQWALERNQLGTAVPTVADLKDFVKKDASIFKDKATGADLGATETKVQDALGNDITFNSVDSAPTISKETYENFTKGETDDVISEADAPQFWGAYYKVAGDND